MKKYGRAQARHCRNMGMHGLYTHLPRDTDRIIIDKSGKADKLYVQHRRRFADFKPHTDRP